jgi:hypothetical protein
MFVQKEEICILCLELDVSPDARTAEVRMSRTFADGLVSSYPLKLTQSITVTTPSNLNPLGSSSRIRRARVAGKADPLYPSACILYLEENEP